MAKQTQGAEILLSSADELQDWARFRGVENDAYVKSLSKALRTGENLSYWSSYEHMEWLPRPRSAAARKMGNIGRVIAIIRNVLIFMPVALTWFAIGKATRAFEIYIATGSQTTANFLEFWQNGGGVLAPEWRIGNIATLDFQIIILLIVLSLAAGVLQVRAIHVANVDNFKFDQERMELALRLDVVLNEYKEMTPLTISRDLAISFEKMVKSARDLATAASRVEKSTTAMAKIDSSSKALLQSIQSAQSIVKGTLIPVVKKGSAETKEFTKQVATSTKSIKVQTSELSKSIKNATPKTTRKLK